MKKIAFIIPYFGKFPKGFKFWLMSCETNPTIDWLIFTDDRTAYNYPKNVKVTYCNFEDIKKRAAKMLGFEPALDRPYKLCDLKPTYGEMFEDKLKGYDFWGHCDIDLVWGDIRKFFTDELLNKYDKLSNQGHACLYRNTPEVNARYKTVIDTVVDYKEVFTSNKSYAFDEPMMEQIYKYLKIPYYVKTNYVHLTKYDYGFFMAHMPKEMDYKNKHQIFVWENGKIWRVYVVNKKIYKEEYMYLHFWCRPISYKVKNYNIKESYLIYPEVVVKKKKPITAKFICRKGNRNMIRFYIKSIWFNRHKITMERIIFNIKGKLKYSKR